MKAEYQHLKQLEDLGLSVEQILKMMRRDRYFLMLTEDIKSRSRCLRAQYGSLIVSADSRIVSTGYNGKPRGSTNDEICYRLDLSDNAAKPNCCIHSEMNAIMFSSPAERRGGTIYISGIPCTDCLLAIIQSGLTRIVYHDQPSYHLGRLHRGNTDEDFLVKYGVPIQVTGYHADRLWSDESPDMTMTFSLEITRVGQILGPFYQEEQPD